MTPASSSTVGLPATGLAPTPVTTVDSHRGHSHELGICWGSVLAGAVAAAVLSLILLLLGTGLGLSAVSPWAYDGASAKTLGFSSLAWIAVMSVAASALGGYLTGRVRKQWSGVHADESSFRDTANGFLSWAVATLVTVTLLSSAIGSLVGGATKAVGSAVSGVASTATMAAAAGAGSAAGSMDDDKGGMDTGSGPMGYFVDSLFRPAPAAAPMGAAGMAPGSATDPAMAGQPMGTAPGGMAMPSSMTGSLGSSGMNTGRNATNGADAGREVTRIFVQAMRSGSLPQDDARYLSQLVAERTGVSPAEAERRVTDTYNRAQAALKEAEMKARAAADEARKASVGISLWMVISLLLGAFAASYAAVLGGRQRIRAEHERQLS